MRSLRGLIVLAAALVIAGAVAAWALSRGGDQRAAASPCRPAVSERVLPPWARTGFSDPRPRMPVAIGREGEIAAIVFGQPLTSPPARDHNNKILWVSRRTVTPLSDLRISAQRMSAAEPIGEPVGRTVRGGPGPSIVDLPAAGCWRLSLRWSDRSDSLDVEYEPRR